MIDENEIIGIWEEEYWNPKEIFKITKSDWIELKKLPAMSYDPNANRRPILGGEIDVAISLEPAWERATDVIRWADRRGVDLKLIIKGTKASGADLTFPDGTTYHFESNPRDGDAFRQIYRKFAI